MGYPSMTVHYYIALNIKCILLTVEGHTLPSGYFFHPRPFDDSPPNYC